MYQEKKRSLFFGLPLSFTTYRIEEKVVNIKKGGGYNYFAYQPSSKSYTKLMKKYKKERRKILFDYKK